MKDIAGWVKAHRWETATGALGLLLVLALILLVVSWSDPPEEMAAESTTTSSAPPTSISSDSTVPDTDDPATPTTEPAPEATQGVTAVVVDNVPNMGFQIGLNSAQLIIETPVEGGLSRFAALYGAEQPGLVGPVRSLRPVSADLLALFRPFVFTTGGQPFVTGAVTASGTTVVIPETSIAFQSLERPQPHHVFVSPATDVSPGTEIEMPWETGAWSGGEPATEVTIPIGGDVTWRFEDGIYVRYRDDVVHEVLSDADAGPEPLTRETLVLLVANQKSAGYTDSAGADVPNFDVVGGGDLYVLHNGEMVQGSWFRASQAAGYTFTDDDGEALSIPDGLLYLAIVPEGQPIDVGG